MKAYYYIRVSGKSQVEGDGPDRQRDVIRAFCEQHNLPFAGEFFEQGVSGTREGMDRPQFAEMIQTIDSHTASDLDPVKVIVVERMDRLARDLMVSEMLLRECRARGIKVFSADQGLLVDMATDGADPTRKLIRQIIGALAEWEKSMLVKKLRAARDRKKRINGKCEGAKPYGALPGEAHILRMLKTLRSSGLTFQAVCNMLNDQQLHTRSGKPWTPNAIHSILKHQPKEEQCVAPTLNT